MERENVTANRQGDWAWLTRAPRPPAETDSRFTHSSLLTQWLPPVVTAADAAAAAASNEALTLSSSTPGGGVFPRTTSPAGRYFLCSVFCIPVTYRRDYRADGRFNATTASKLKIGHLLLLWLMLRVHLKRRQL